MPTFKQTLQDTYLPLQAAEKRWEAAKTTAGAAFTQLAAEEKALEEIALRRQQYAETIRPRESNDAFLYQAIAGLTAAAAAPGASGNKPAAKKSAFDEAYDNLKNVKAGSNFGQGQPARVALDKALSTAKTKEEWDRAYGIAGGKGALPTLVRPTLPTEAEVKAKAAAGDARAKAILAERQAGAQAQYETAENLGARAFEGGQEAQDWYEALPENKRQMLNVFASALMDDGKVTPEELGDIDSKEAQELYDQAKSRKAYRRQDRAAYDPRYLELSRIESEKRAKFEEKKAKLGQTPEELALKLYRGTADGPKLDPLTGLPIDVSAKIPPILRELKPDMEKVLKSFEASEEEDFETWALSYMDKKAQAAYTVALNMAKAGKGASEIQAALAQSGLPVDVQRGALVTLASRDLVNQTRSASAPGSTPETVRDIRKVDEQAKRDELEAEKAKAEKEYDDLTRATRGPQSRTIPELMARVAALEESTAKAKEDEETARLRAMLSPLYETALSQPKPQPKPQPNPSVPEVPPAETPAPPSGGSTAGGPPEEEGPNLGGVAPGAVGYTFVDESDPDKVKYVRTESGFKALFGPYAGREFYHWTKPGTALSLVERGDYKGLKKLQDSIQQTNTRNTDPNPSPSPVGADGVPESLRPGEKTTPSPVGADGVPESLRPGEKTTPQTKESDALLEAMMGLERGSEAYNQALKKLNALKAAGK